MHHSDPNDRLLLIGIDAGGTSAKTRACWAGAATVAPLMRRGAANVNREGIDAVATTLAECVADAVDQACSEHTRSIRLRVAAGIAGAGDAASRRRLHEALSARLHPEYTPDALHIVTDADLVLADATRGEPGLVAIAGTGSIVLARDAAGTIHRGGGWGYLLGDDGGGYALGRHALRAALVAWEGGTPTRIADLLTTRHALTSRDDVVQVVYREDWPPSRAVPVLLAAAEADDAVALGILGHETRALAEQVARLAERNDPVPSVLHLAGGLGDEPAYRAALKTSLAQVWPTGALAAEPVDPLRGALRLAEHGVD